MSPTPRDLPSRPQDRLAARLARVHLLTMLAFSAPLLIVAGDRPIYFLSYHFDDLDLALTGTLIAFGPLLLLLPVELWLVPRWPRGHDLILASLTSFLALEICGWRLDLEGYPQVAATLFSTLLVFPVIRLVPRSPLQIAAFYLVTVSLPAWFFFASPVSALFSLQEDPLPQVRVERPAPVMMLVFDSLPLAALLDEQGEIDGAMFPNFAALSRQSHDFRNATANHCDTLVSIPTMLTGILPRPGKIVIANHYPENLFRLLAATHDLRIADPYSWMAPRNAPAVTRYRPTRADRHLATWSDLKLMAPAIFRSPLSRTSLSDLVQNLAVNGMQITSESLLPGRFDRALFLREMLSDLGRRSERPPFFYSHVYLPHSPWVHTPEGPRYPLADEHNGVVMKVMGLTQTIFFWKSDPWTVHQSFQRALLQVRFADRLLGEAIAALKTADLWDRTLLVVTADHGFAVGAGTFIRDPILPDSPLVTSGKFRATHQGILTVPLMIKLPGQAEGVRSDSSAQLVDVLPTIADVMGIASPYPMDGRSLLDPDADPRDGKIYYDFQFERHELPPILGDIRSTVREWRSWFAPGPAPGWNYRLLPHGDLVGREVAGIPRATMSGWQVEQLGTPHDPHGVVTGQITLPDRQTGPVHLALIHQGRILAVTRTQRPGKRHTFLAFHDPSAGPVRAADLSVVLLVERDGSVVLVGDESPAPGP